MTAQIQKTTLTFSEFDTIMRGLSYKAVVLLSEVPDVAVDDLLDFMQGKTWTEIDGQSAIWQHDFKKFWDRLCSVGLSYRVQFTPKSS